jgi:hypothetical protein
MVWTQALMGGKEPARAAVLADATLLTAATNETVTALRDWLGESLASKVVQLHPQVLTLGRKHVRGVRKTLEYVLNCDEQARALADLRPQLLLCSRETLRKRFMILYRHLGDAESRLELLVRAPPCLPLRARERRARVSFELCSISAPTGEASLEYGTSCQPYKPSHFC